MSKLIYLIALYLCFCGLLCISCDPHVAYEKNVRVKDSQWVRETLPLFEFHVSDTTQRYGICVHVRHSNFYRYSNLVFSLRERHRPKIDTTYRVDLSLTKSDGRWLGKSAGNLYLMTYPIQENYVFPDTGTYYFTLEHHMEDQYLQGITDLGLQILKQP